MKSNFLTLSFGFTLIIALAVLGIWPLVSQHQNILSQIKSSQNQQEALRVKKGIVERLTKDQATLATEAKRAQELIPSTEQRESFATELDQLAQTNNGRLATLTFQEKKEQTAPKGESAQAAANRKKTKSQLKSLNYRATVIGSYPDLQKILTGLSVSKRYTHLTSLTLAPSEDKLALTIEGTIYSKALPISGQSLVYKPEEWQFLNRRPTQIIPTSGRIDPFITY